MQDAQVRVPHQDGHTLVCQEVAGQVEQLQGAQTLLPSTSRWQRLQTVCRCIQVSEADSTHRSHHFFHGYLLPCVENAMPLHAPKLMTKAIFSRQFPWISSKQPKLLLLNSWKTTWLHLFYLFLYSVFYLRIQAWLWSQLSAVFWNLNLSLLHLLLSVCPLKECCWVSCSQIYELWKPPFREIFVRLQQRDIYLAKSLVIPDNGHIGCFQPFAIRHTVTSTFVSLSNYLFYYYYYFFNLLTFRERQGGRQRNISLLFPLFMHHWLTLVCALTGDWTHNLGHQDDSFTNWAPGQGNYFFRLRFPEANPVLHILPNWAPERLILNYNIYCVYYIFKHFLEFPKIFFRKSNQKYWDV